MTRYEQLQNKATLCRLAAFSTKGRMREIWLLKANELETMAGNLPVINASQKGGENAGY